MTLLPMTVNGEAEHVPMARVIGGIRRLHFLAATRVYIDLAVE